MTFQDDDIPPRTWIDTRTGRVDRELQDAWDPVIQDRNRRMEELQQRSKPPARPHLIASRRRTAR